MKSAFIVLVLAFTVPAQPQDTSVRDFQWIEQSLMDALTSGNKSVWNDVLDATCVYTNEEGKVWSKEMLLEDITGLPPGLSGDIRVKELTVQNLNGVALVRYLADETEKVFGQQLATKYRVTDAFVKREAKWKMVSSHISVVTADPPAQNVDKTIWQSFVGTYKLMPDGWDFYVELRGDHLYGGRNKDKAKLRLFVPLTPNAFVLSGSLGEWIFASDKEGKVTHILDFRKFEPLVWTRVSEQPKQ